jgi:hypothetical protein
MIASRGRVLQILLGGRVAEIEPAPLQLLKGRLGALAIRRVEASASQIGASSPCVRAPFALTLLGPEPDANGCGDASDHRAHGSGPDGAAHLVEVTSAAGRRAPPVRPLKNGCSTRHSPPTNACCSRSQEGSARPSVRITPARGCRKPSCERWLRTKG